MKGEGERARDRGRYIEKEIEIARHSDTVLRERNHFNHTILIDIKQKNIIDQQNRIKYSTKLIIIH